MIIKCDARSERPHFGNFTLYALCRPSCVDCRFKRFNEDYKTIPEREELLDMLEQAAYHVWFPL